MGRRICTHCFHLENQHYLYIHHFKNSCIIFLCFSVTEVHLFPAYGRPRLNVKPKRTTVLLGTTSLLKLFMRAECSARCNICCPLSQPNSYIWDLNAEISVAILKRICLIQALTSLVLTGFLTLKEIKQLWYISSKNVLSVNLSKSIGTYKHSLSGFTYQV